jgi:agmatinase
VDSRVNSSAKGATNMVLAVDPNQVSVPNGCFFGFAGSVEDATVVLLPVPWDVTTSYGEGAAYGPQAMLDASTQLDWYDFDVPNAWQIGHGTVPISAEILAKNQQMRSLAKQIIKHLELGGDLSASSIQTLLEQVNQASTELNDWVETQTRSLLAQGKLIGLVGGDHSAPLGFMRALANCYQSYGILQIDAHADLRAGYEGFIYSHASIMYHALQIPAVERLVQVGIRDVCQAEMAIAQGDLRVATFDDWQLKANAYQGMTWGTQVKTMIDQLPDHVYISFDIDGLDPAFCPNTGTPVPGGLGFNQAIYLVQQVVNAGKMIIGFDLCEVAPKADSEWDGNVGARLLYKLSNLMYKSCQLKATSHS